MKCRKLLILLMILVFSFSCQAPFIEEEESNGNDPFLQTIDNSKGFGTLNIIADIGEVQYMAIEGGFWGIVGSKGNYDPINLPQAYRIPGLKVIFVAQVMEDMASIHMWGKIIRILSIHKINPPQNNIFTDIGVIKYFGFGGGFWGIVGSKGNYDPINLPHDFRIDGLKVILVAEKLEGVASIHMWGSVIKIITIHKII